MCWRVESLFRTQSASEQEESLTVLIPVNQGVSLLRRTIESIRAQDRAPNILVCLDGPCREIHEYLVAENITFIENSSNLGKWHSLIRLIEAAQDHGWIALVDAGTVWPRDLLQRISADLSRSKLTAIAPSYRSIQCGRGARLHWEIERRLKQFENLAGGPISVHGATCFYRASSLKKAVSVVEGETFLNDDVVLPLLVRSVSGGTIRYRADAVVFDDEGDLSSEHRIYRQLRIARGNQEWMGRLFQKIVFRSPTSAILSLRRMVRAVFPLAIILATAPKRRLAAEGRWA